MTDYENEVLSVLKGIQGEMSAFREERQALRREEEAKNAHFLSQLTTEKEARRKEHEAYLATVQSGLCEGSPLSNH